MVVRVEAKSLEMLTRLADDPPLHIRRYPRQPPPPSSSSHHLHHQSSSAPTVNQLKLYIVRVPNSQDIILTPLKPLCSTVTAQDIISCLYYLRVQPLESSKPRSKSLQPEHLPGREPVSPFENVGPSQPRTSYNGDSSSASIRSGQTGSFLSPTSPDFSMNSMLHHVACGNDFEITFIRRDQASGSQQTIGRIYSNHNGPLDTVPQIPNSFAAQMMAQEAMLSKKGKRDRKRLNLEIFTPGYQKFLCQRPARSPANSSEAPDTGRPSTGSSSDNGGFSDYLWPAPIPPPPPGFEDVGPPPPPKDSPRLSPMMNPALAHMARPSRFTEIYSPDTPVAPKQPNVEQLEYEDDDADGIFKRTLHLAGDSFWKSTGKRISAFHAAHRKKRSGEGSSPYSVDEEARVAMQQMGVYPTTTTTPASPSSISSCPPLGSPSAEESKKETKGKGYIFSPPVRTSGKCEFETNGIGRKIRLRLHPPSTTVGSPYGNSTVVRPEPILLSTISFQPPNNTDVRSPSPSASSFKNSSSSSSGGHGRTSSKFKLVGEKFKAKLHRADSWTEHVEAEAGSGLKSKLGSLLVEEEGMDALDMVVVSCMGVFWKRYCEWTEEIKEGGI
ncbi:hypothetical protein AA313_de0201690 [Arthrobotrys entomopaga]|nr:hypothetical protein AA313_de0201690 [Arthrobotrys entomopaga]